MTEALASDGLEPVRPVAELLSRSCQALWATTYNVELGLFAEFLLPRLGDPPVNAVVLADAHRLAATLDRIPLEQSDSLTTVNRRWLLRGIRHGSGVFHPKTYLSVTGTQATLLVGSGNLSTDGLDRGHEIFTVFRAGTPTGDAALRTWREWMLRLVEDQDDLTLAGRFADLNKRLPEIATVAPPELSPLLHNLDDPIMDQLLQHGDPGVDELLLAAPYYDKHAETVAVLVKRIRPASVSVFTTSTTSVDGRRLAAVLDASGVPARALAYEPDEFIHAKLVGAISGGMGWVLSGSPNLSLRALTMAPPEGNVEMAVFTRMSAGGVRALFLPPGKTARELDLTNLEPLKFTPDAESAPPPVHLRRATATRDHRIEIASTPAPEPDWLLDDLELRHPLTIDDSGARTQSPVTSRQVRVVDAEGTVLSNRVVVDDVDALDAALREPTASGSDRPPELDAGDVEGPLGRGLVWLHRNLVMDVTEVTTEHAGGSAASSDEAESGEDELWDRLEREQLGRDPRAGTYRGMWGRGLGVHDDQPLIELLEAMRNRVPSSDRREANVAPVLSLLDHLKEKDALEQKPEHDESGGEEKPKARWGARARIRVRTRNVLRRWATAQTDPRLLWIDPFAPVGNFAMVTCMLAYLWIESLAGTADVELTEDDLADLWYRWLRSFVGSGEGEGLLDRFDDDDRPRALQHLPDEVPQLVPLLCYLAIRPRGGMREMIIIWQPIVTAALRHHLLDPSDASARLLSSATGQRVDIADVDRRLMECVEFIDDDLWCQQTAERLGIPTVRLEALPGAAHVGVRVDITGVPDPLTDPRIPKLIADAQRYRRRTGVAVYSGDARWRLVAAPGEPVILLSGRGGTRQETRESSQVLDRTTLKALIASGAVLADVFHSDEVA